MWEKIRPTIAQAIAGIVLAVLSAAGGAVGNHVLRPPAAAVAPAEAEPVEAPDPAALAGIHAVARLGLDTALRVEDRMADLGAQLAMIQLQLDDRLPRKAADPVQPATPAVAKPKRPRSKVEGPGWMGPFGFRL